jgi:hydroxyethylthiazole kinase
MLKEISQCLLAVRDKTPLVQAITNYVTINDCANILLAFGASPAMCEARTEVEEFVALASSLYINLGTLTGEQWDAALLAARRAAELKKPVILDPVACGAISQKVRFIEQLFAGGPVTVIKGNMGEIKSLAGYQAQVRGMDSVDDGDGGINACRSLARKYHCIVAATGPTDIISDGERTCLVNNGTPLLTMITGAGCMAGALVSAAVGANDDPYTATVAAITAMGMAGEKAAASMPVPLPGTFRVKLFDSIYSLTEKDIQEGGKIQCL